MGEQHIAAKAQQLVAFVGMEEPEVGTAAFALPGAATGIVGASTKRGPRCLGLEGFHDASSSISMGCPAASEKRDDKPLTSAKKVPKSHNDAAGNQTWTFCTKDHVTKGESNVLCAVS
ncbi:hypothetical protein [Ralstonia soli]|uniref:Uncharacterized protein n=1 Tax=Ralstonia soli TaxID=2953896 RepID=A0ABT1AHT1_9RALS|nr:hypothetical protein [Ralstonia soli]MCO5397876.1 hypothetical protein [Ralstonia soli]